MVTVGATVTLTHTAGVLVLGGMADVGIGPWGEEPTFHAPVFVVTHRSAETVAKRGGTS